MSRRGGNFASTARNAPFGTDVQPTTKVKIIGGKAVEVAERTPPSSASRQKSGEVLRNGPHGTPPMQYQPPVKESNNNSYNNSPEPLPNGYRKIYSQTAPRDISNSHIHSTGRIQEDRSKPLPPIQGESNQDAGDHGEDRSSSNGQEDPFTIKDLLRKPFPVKLASTPVLSPIANKPSLTEQVSQHLANYDALHFKEMYTDLAEFDHGLHGYVSQAQMNMVGHQHKLPIPLTTLRLLFSNFAKESNPDIVNYEKLIQFLARAKLGSAKAQTLLQANVEKFVHEAEDQGATDQELARLDNQIKKYEEHEEAKKRHQEREKQKEKERKMAKQQEKWKPSFETKKPLRTFSELDDAKLIRTLEEQFTDGKKKKTIDIEGMRAMCLKKDKHQQGTFSQKDLDELFLFYRIPIQGSLLNKMIQRMDTGNGQLSWITLLDLLERVNSGDISTPRQDSNQSSQRDQRRSSEQLGARNSPSMDHWSNPAVAGRSSREGSRDGARLVADPHLRPVESRRPNTWPKRPIREALPSPEPDNVASPPWLRQPLARIETTQRKHDPDVSQVELEITRNDTPTDQHVTPSPPPLSPPFEGEDYEIEQLRRVAKEYRQRPQQRHRAEQDVAATSQQQNEKQRREDWFKGFLHLAKGLYSNDAAKTGCLDKEEMFRLVTNYNLIYQLGISPSHIKRVVETCCHEGDEVPIQPVLEILRQKKK
ncbi:uncharacterized protein [Diadema antillarum]|uniref:uncharacterized protein n=1 Tax=Diadema antillarum TaxID=105358 RepID=UPI003A87A4F3